LVTLQKRAGMHNVNIDINDSILFELLCKIDIEIAKDYRQKLCPHCGSACHFANYYRKARGVDNEYCLRFSVCCSKCRKRRHIPSTLFFGSFVYGSVFFFFISCLSESAGYRYKNIALKFNISERTLRRWKKWWQDIFPTTVFWKEARGFVNIFNNSSIYLKDILMEFSSSIKAFQFFSHFKSREVLSRNRC
jgi:hypothetical protein